MQESAQKLSNPEDWNAGRPKRKMKTINLEFFTQQKSILKKWKQYTGFFR